MTATTPARRVISTAPPCPPGCDGHTPHLEMHVRDLPRTWGDVDAGPVLGLALERNDEHGTGQPYINVQYSRDGVMVDDNTVLGFDAAEDYATTMLQLIALGRARWRA